MWKHGEITSALLSITLITFANEAAVDNAELACRKNRVAIMLLFLVRFEYQELIDVKAIGISYQMHGLVCVDKHKEVLRPSIIWCDSRAVQIGAAADGIGQIRDKLPGLS